jgi:hypothetical protein
VAGEELLVPLHEPGDVEVSVELADVVEAFDVEGVDGVGVGGAHERLSLARAVVGAAEEVVRAGHEACGGDRGLVPGIGGVGVAEAFGGLGDHERDACGLDLRVVG